MTTRQAYDLLLHSARGVFAALDRAGDSAVMRQYAGVLECLLRLRQVSAIRRLQPLGGKRVALTGPPQVCLAPGLVSAARLERARQVLAALAASGADVNATAVRALAPPPTPFPVLTGQVSSLSSY